MAKATLSGKAAAAQADLEELKRDHDDLVDEIKLAEDAYNGIFERKAEVGNWVHKETPRYVQHIVETTIAAMIDPDLKFQIEPRAKHYDDGEFATASEGAKALERLLTWQLEQDRFNEKQRDMLLQERFSGISWAKVYWHRSTRMKKKLVKQGLFPRLVETEVPAVEFDGPCMQVVNTRDIVWDMGAPDVERCSLIGHRIWVTYAEALAYQRAGAWSNVERLKDAEQGEQGKEERRRQGRIEVWEIWKREDNGKLMVYTVGENNVLLKERESPYWHGQMPFVFFSSRKKPLQLNGWSQIDQLRDVQQQLWSVENLTLDALMLSIMPIIMYREDLDDPDALVFEPYARWPVTDPNSSVKMWTPEYNQAQVGLPHIQRLKADLQNLAGSQPFTSTSEARTAQANTATEASLVASIAQRSMTTAKTHWFQTVQRVGQQFIELDQQYVRDPVYVSVLDIDQPQEISEILPEMLQGEFAFSIRPMTESLIREQRRAEATSQFQALSQFVPILAGISMQTGGQVPAIDPWALIGDYLDAFDRGPVEKYKMNVQPPQPQAPPPGAAPQQNPQQPPGGQGVTNPALAAGLEAPSNAMSQNPASMMQQFLAGQSGGQNA